MKLDLPTVVLILCAVFFYVRIAIIQRSHAKRINQPSRGGKATRAKKASLPVRQENPYWIFSPYRRDWIICGLGVVLMVVGVLQKTQIIQISTLNEYWWIPLGLGIIGFSFGFR